MANGKITLGKQSGGTLGLVFPDGVSDTEVILPESGELATKDSPALTGTPTAPTAEVGTNTTQIATTAFVLANSIPLSDSVSTTSSTTAASSKAVKTAYDLANTANGKGISSWSFTGSASTLNASGGTTGSVVYSGYATATMTINGVSKTANIARTSYKCNCNCCD